MSIFAASTRSVVLGDLYALQQFIYESKVGPDRFYLKLEEGSFQRPSYFIKLVNSDLTSHHRSMRWITSQVMVQLFSEDFYEAQIVANDLQMLLSGAPLFADVILPRYDFTTQPPTKLLVSGWTKDGTYDSSNCIGARIDPTTINSSGVIQESNRAWNVSITFTMQSAMPTFQDLPLMENIEFDILTGKPIMPQIRTSCIYGEPAVDVIVT